MYRFFFGKDRPIKECAEKLKKQNETLKKDGKERDAFLKRVKEYRKECERRVDAMKSTEKPSAEQPNNNSTTTPKMG